MRRSENGIVRLSWSRLRRAQLITMRSKPGLQRRPPFKSLDPVRDAKPRILDDLLGHCLALDVGRRDTEHQRLVARNQRSESRLVAASQAQHELPVSCGGGDRANP